MRRRHPGAGSSTGPSQAREALRTVSPGRVVAIIAGVWALLLFLVLRSSYWAYDDWLYFFLSRRDGAFSSTWLTSVYFQHFAPGHRALTSVVANAMPISYAWGLIAFLGCLVGSAVLFERCARLLWGVRWLHVVGAVLLLVTSVHIRSLIWWSAGLQIFPTLLLELGILYGFLRHRADGRLRWHALSLAALALALMFYIRPLVMPVYLVLIEVLMTSGSLRPRAIAARLWRRRGIWQGYLLVCGIYLAYWVGRGAYASAGPGQDVTLGDIGHYAGIAWLRDYAPSLLGIRVQESATGAQGMAVILAELLVAAVVTVSVVRRRSALRAWAFFALAGFISLLVTSGRIKYLGVKAGYDSRYMVELTWLFPLALSGALARDQAPPPLADPPGAVRKPRWRVAVAVAAALIVVAGLSARTARDIERAWPGAQAHGFVEHLRAGLQGVSTRSVVADGPVADWLMPEFSTFNQLRNIAPFIVGPRRIDGAPGDRIVTVLDSGTVVPATLRDDLGADLMLRRGAGAPQVSGAASVRRDGAGLCVTAGVTPARVLLHPPQVIRGDRIYAAVRGVGVGHSVAIPTTVDLGGGLVTTTSVPLVMASTIQTSLLWLQTATAVAVALDIPAATAVCLQSVRVGPLVTQQPQP